MGRYESPIQVVGLFLAASVMSIGVIFFLNAEAHSRLHHNSPQKDEHISSQSPSAPYFSYLTQEEGRHHQTEAESYHQSIVEENNIINRNNNNINQDNNGKSFSFSCIFLYFFFRFLSGELRYSLVMSSFYGLALSAHAIP